MGVIRYWLFYNPKSDTNRDYSCDRCLGPMFQVFQSICLRHLDVIFTPLVSVFLARFLAVIMRCVVGGGWAVFSAVEAADLFLFRSVRGCTWSVYASDVSLCRTLTPPRTIRCSFPFLLFPGLFVVVVAVWPVLVRFVSPALLRAVGVVLEGVVGVLNLTTI